MKRILPLLFLALLIISCKQGPSHSNRNAPGKNTLVLYCDDEFMSSGLGAKVIPLFEQKNKCSVEVVNMPDAGLMMERMKGERNHPQADVVIGLNNTFLQEIVEGNLLESYHPTGLHVIPREFLYDPVYRLVPYAYGYLAIVYDSDTVNDPPETFGELQDERYKRQLLVPDAMKSAFGRACLYWTLAAFGPEGYEQFWSSIRKNITQFTPTWFNSRQLFMQDQGTMMMGLTTTPAYYNETLSNDKVRSFVPDEGSFMVLPSAGLVRKAHHAGLGKKFLDFTLSESFQKMIPETLWMYPIDQSVSIPASFSLAPLSVITLNKNLTGGSIQDKLYEFWVRYSSYME